MSSARILAFSSSREGQSGFLQTAIPVIQAFLGPEKLRIAFIAFAGITKNETEYLAMVREAFKSLPYTIDLVTPKDAKKIIQDADVIMTGGGNTFKLLHDIYAYKLLDVIRDKVTAGAAYIGWSAGANITGPTIGTTNDMPVIQPLSFNALGLFPFQINPHYFNKTVEGFNGETRDQRLIEFSLLNPGLAIVCLPEGTALQFEKGNLALTGSSPAVLFYFEENAVVATKRNIYPGEDLSFLL